ncbi:DUF4173 domain-containing protein [Paenibacillus sp. JX-17]|uniref:DUF4173 domain-containing protein n=1 Tax=Paenibacillus lacisoli TaxID=3064525 RepID=A0ABT9CCH5_9BACL|nr:DUF4153 domain-containing protein [Paenibacillus sp. JX-17]MDO7906962.1 DUF4173 domain-containing protein [Paenibacillus sp. JX-17]
MIYLAVMLLITGVRIAVTRLPLAPCFMLVSLAAYMVINYVSWDAWVVRANVERYQVNRTLDPAYLVELSADAVPELVKLVENDGSPYIHNAFNKKLEQKLDEIRQENTGWPSFNVSRFRAQQSLEAYVQQR